MDKLILTATIRGVEVTKEQNPAAPYMIDEIACEAKSAYDAGVAVIHVHVHEGDDTPTQPKIRFRKTLDTIYKVIPDVIVIPSTGGVVGMTAEERLQPTELIPEMVTLDCGTCNFGDDVFENTIPMMRAFGKCTIENRTRPEHECFEMGHLDTILHLAQRGEIPGDPMRSNSVLDVFGCTSATADNLAWLVNNIPAGPIWTATGISCHELPLVTVVIGMGGHIRVGFEDNLYLLKGVPVKSNGELVAKAARIAHELDRKIANPAEARQILSSAPRH